MIITINNIYNLIYKSEKNIQFYENSEFQKV